MVQVKKDAVRDAVLASASRLFEKKGYNATTISQIAAGAKTASSNVYVYFSSKFEIAFAIYQPWLEDEIRKLESDANKITDPEKRLYRIIDQLWNDIPAKRNGFARNFIQAVSNTTAAEGYSPALLKYMEDRIGVLIRSCLTPERRKAINWAKVSKILVMAFDGFVINQPLHPDAKTDKALVNAAVHMILGH